MSNEKNVTVVPEFETTKGNARGRYTAYLQAMRKMELNAKEQQNDAEQKGGNQ